MRLKTPEIAWHDTTPVYSCDFQPKAEPVQEPWSRLATCGRDNIIRIWRVPLTTASPEFLASLRRHDKPVNVVRFCPTGEDLLASGGDDGVVILWRREVSTTSAAASASSRALFGQEGEEEEGREMWQVKRVLRLHLEDIYDLCWSSSGDCLVSGSVDQSAIEWNLKSGQQLLLKDHKAYVQGVAWDPRDEYVLSLGSDRSCRVYRVGSRNCSYNVVRHEKQRLFQDDSWKSFFRRLSYSPDGAILVCPSGCIGNESHGAYVFTRQSMPSPVLALPTENRPVVGVRFCPTPFALPKDCTPLFGLPYMWVFCLVLEDGLLFYNTVSEHPIAYVGGVHYQALNDASWSMDGRLVSVCSTDGYCTLVRFEEHELGRPCEEKANLSAAFAEELANAAEEAKKTSGSAPDGKKTSADAKKPSIISSDASKTSIHSLDVRKASLPTSDAKKTPVESSDSRKTSVPSLDAKKTSVESSDSRKTSVPTLDAKKTSVESSDSRKTSVPSSDAKKTSVESSDSRKTSVPSSDAKKTSVEFSDVSEISHPELLVEKDDKKLKASEVPNEKKKRKSEKETKIQAEAKVLKVKKVKKVEANSKEPKKETFKKVKEYDKEPKMDPIKNQEEDIEANEVPKNVTIKKKQIESEGKANRMEAGKAEALPKATVVVARTKRPPSEPCAAISGSLPNAQAPTANTPAKKKRRVTFMTLKDKEEEEEVSVPVPVPAEPSSPEPSRKSRRVTITTLSSQPGGPAGGSPLQPMTRRVNFTTISHNVVTPDVLLDNLSNQSVPEFQLHLEDSNQGKLEVNEPSPQ